MDIASASFNLRRALTPTSKTNSLKATLVCKECFLFLTNLTSVVRLVRTTVRDALRLLDLIHKVVKVDDG